MKKLIFLTIILTICSGCASFYPKVPNFYVPSEPEEKLLPIVLDVRSSDEHEKIILKSYKDSLLFKDVFSAKEYKDLNSKHWKATIDIHHGTGEGVQGMGASVLMLFCLSTGFLIPFPINSYRMKLVINIFTPEGLPLSKIEELENYSEFFGLIFLFWYFSKNDYDDSNLLYDMSLHSIIRAYRKGKFQD